MEMKKPLNNKIGYSDEVVDEMLECITVVFNIDYIKMARIGSGLNDKNRLRIKKKLALVEKGALMLARGMIKGTLKYSSDPTDVKDYWMPHLLDDLSDSLNYALLMQENM